VELAVSPRVALASPDAVYVPVKAALVIREPTPEIRCAAVAWAWGDGSRSGWESDCPPLEELEPWPDGSPLVIRGEHVRRKHRR
jgi:hypothetical protein